MAVPGDTTCREVMACGAGRWGAIPVEPTTIYVDQSYDSSAGPSDGTESRPFVTIGEAVAAAPAGGLIAIAAGSYQEDVRIADEPLRLWGKCPAEVELVGTDDGIGPVDVFGVSAEIAGLALRGSGYGVIASAADGVDLHGLWIHDNAFGGVYLDDFQGATVATLSDSLIEQNQEQGIFTMGAEVTIDGVVVRDTLSSTVDQFGGQGLVVLDSPTQGRRSVIAMRSAVVEANHVAGIHVEGSDLLLESVVVRDTQPHPTSGEHGVGVSVLETAESIAGASAVLRGAFIANNHQTGLFVAGSAIELDAVVIRDTLPQLATGYGGSGLIISNNPDGGARATASVRRSIIEQNAEVGVFVMGSDAELDGVAIRDTSPRQTDRRFGHGLQIQHDPGGDERAIVSVRASLIEQSHSVGMAVVGSNAHLAGVSIVDTRPHPDTALYGDAIVVGSLTLEGWAELSSCSVRESARAGLSVFGATANIAATQLECNPIHLAVEPHGAFEPLLTNAGANRCSCAEDEVVCRAVSVGLEPPTPADPAP
jgi:hypothetical protein